MANSSRFLRSLRNYEMLDVGRTSIARTGRYVCGVRSAAGAKMGTASDSKNNEDVSTGYVYFELSKIRSRYGCFPNEQRCVKCIQMLLRGASPPECNLARGAAYFKVAQIICWAVSAYHYLTPYGGWSPWSPCPLSARCARFGAVRLSKKGPGEDTPREPTDRYIC